MSLVISGATIIDGAADRAIAGRSLWIEGNRIRAIAPPDELPVSPTIKVIDAQGKFLIPGLMNANVHLVLGFLMEDLVRYEGRYTDLIIEAAQIALKNGLTTVFDTWGPRQPLMTVRDKINAGEVPGSRLFCAGNIVGLDGPFSEDFFPKTLQVATPALVEKINSLWVENVGPHLTWMTPDQVAQQIRAYIGTGIDFIKYASSEHRVPVGASAFLAFSRESQAAIVDEAHRAGLTAQAHTQSVEALRVAIEAGSNIIQHCNITGPTPIPSTTLELLVKKKTASTVFPLTERRSEWIKSTGDTLLSPLFSDVAVDINVRNLIRSGAMLLLANDGGIMGTSAADPLLGAAASGDDNLFDLDQGHFHWFKAMEEKGLAPMEALRAATRNIAIAYKKDQDLGTLQPGKIADLIILDKDPLKAAEHYRSIHMILKDGIVVDRSVLPLHPILTKPVEPGAERTATSYRRARAGGFPALLLLILQSYKSQRM